MQQTILLDTHVIIWLYESRKKFGPEAMRLLESSNQSLAVSYISLMEIAIKNATGKLKYEDEIFDDLAELGIEVIAPSRELLSRYRIFSPANKDPFDNLIIATALAQKSALMTSDRQILDTKSKGLKLLDANK